MYFGLFPIGAKEYLQFFKYGVRFAFTLKYVHVNLLIYFKYRRKLDFCLTYLSTHNAFSYYYSTHEESKC